MAGNSSQQGTSAASSKIIYNTVSENEIGNYTQNIYGNAIVHQSTPSTSSTHALKRNPINNTELAVNTFIGRETELKDIKQLFHQYPVVVIAAMGGICKTQLARKFAFENANEYRVRYWINAETEEQLLKSIDRLARKVKVEANTDIDTVRGTYRSFTEGAALLIFDNVEHVNNVYDYLPTRIQLEDITLHVLVTSRWTEWTTDSSVNCYQLQPLDISVSLQLFQRKFSKTCIETMQDKWKELARMLGYLPLALQVATSYIYKRNKHNSDLPMVLADYMKQLREGAAGLLNDPLTEYGNHSVYTSMLLTLKQLENKTDDKWKFSVTLINAAAYMDPDWIVKERLSKLLDNEDKPCILDEALVILTEYSIFNQRVGRGGDPIYSVHRIIQTSIRHNQTVLGTADMYYIRLLKYAFAEDYFPRDVLQYVNVRAPAVADYYKNNPSPTILKYLVVNKGITAMEAALKLCTKQIQIEMKEQELLHLAVDSEDLRMVELLCRYGADINQLCRVGRELPLHRALRRRNMEIATWMLENGAAPIQRGWSGRNALHVAIIYANHQMVSNIIKTDTAVVNETDNDGRTPLLSIDYSYNEGDILSIINVLAESGADITAVDKRGNTVLHSVAKGACAGAVSLILQLNKNLINIVNKYGETALHVMSYGDTRIDDERILSTMRVLVDSGVALTKVDRRGCTVLHLAARGSRAAAVSLILQRNKDLINIKNKIGETALHVLGNGFIFKFQYLQDADRKNLFPRTKGTSRVLIMNGLSINTIDNKGFTPLDTVNPEFKNILLQVAVECNNPLLVRPVKRQRTE